MKNNINNATRYAFDVEVFQNFFCVTFVSVDRKDIRQFTIWNSLDERKKLREFLNRQPYLISFNGISYDLPVIRYVINSEDNSKALLQNVFKLSSKLVNDNFRQDEEILKLRYPKDEDFLHQDLMAMMNFVNTGVGLKQIAVQLKWKRLQDLPYPYNHTITTMLEYESILDYNINDVLITLELYDNKTVSEYREIRESLYNDFGMKILSASKSKMANIMLERMYEHETGIPRYDFMKLRTHRDSVALSDIILPNISFVTEELQEFLSNLKKIIIYAHSDFKFSYKVPFMGNVYNFGVGGLHTQDNPGKHVSTDSKTILSMDVSSFYPAIMCQYNVKPEHLTDDFIFILDRVRRERLEYKKSGNKLKAESYKILINSVFGKMGFSDYWLYDPQAMFKVTINGQLMLLMLAERMEVSGIKCITGNTDGIEVLSPNNLLNTVASIAKEWEKETLMELEFAKYSLMVKKDVNSYLAVDEYGKVKEKGSAFLTTVNLEKGYKYPVVAKALRAYFIDNTPVEKTIYECNDILDFCLSQKMRGDFTAEIMNINERIVLQKSNRFYVTNSNGYALQKVKKGSNKRIGVTVGKLIRILNDYDDSVDFNSYDVNKIYYISEAKKIIDKIEPMATQYSMFPNDISYGSYKNMSGDIVSKRSSNSNHKLTNQSSAVVTKQEIEKSDKKKIRYDAPPTWFIVKNVDTKFSPVIIAQSLSANTMHKFKVSKDLFRKTPVRENDIIDIKKYEKKNKQIKTENGFEKIPDKFEIWVTEYCNKKDVSQLKRKQ